jgi:hypothetical protein
VVSIYLNTTRILFVGTRGAERLYATIDFGVAPVYNSITVWSVATLRNDPSIPAAVLGARLPRNFNFLLDLSVPRAVRIATRLFVAETLGAAGVYPDVYGASRGVSRR